MIINLKISLNMSHKISVYFQLAFEIHVDFVIDDYATNIQNMVKNAD